MEKSFESIATWIALKMIPNLGNITYKRLLERFGDPGAVFNATLDDLVKVEGLRVATAKSIVSKAWEGDPWKELARLKKTGTRIIPFSDPSYPENLREIYDPPPFLYLKGNDIPSNMTVVAVVGSRNPSHYGLKVTEEICQGLAMSNIAVVSGMAKGIDAAAHWGCLKRKGCTIAVLGSGLDVIYPRSNITLFNTIIREGSVITEFPLGTPPEAKNFPIRNRIISGISRGVVVVEASKRSGSLITASLALEQGREVFAVPGSVASFKSTGTHFLIKQGAKLIENADDILKELSLEYSSEKIHDNNKKSPLPLMEEDEQRIFEIVSNYTLHIDEIARLSTMDSARVAGILTRLELRGVIRQVPGKMFVRA